MATVYRWRVRCVTDNKFEYIWSETEPTGCPIDTGHIIDATKTAVVNKIEENYVKIKEESIPTGEHFACETVTVEIEPKNSASKEVSWPIPIVIYNMTFTTTDDHIGDTFNVDVSPNTVIGAITASSKAGDTIISVTDTVLENIKIGYQINLTDGKNLDNLGIIVSIDIINKTITVSSPTIHDFSPLEPTYVIMTVNLIKNYEIGPSGYKIINRSKIGGTYVPPGTIMELSYNNGGSIPKKIVFQIEYTY
jgi:hypothetical protein